MIKPLTLGKTTFPINIIQGPLAGISSAPFRVQTWKYGNPAFSCTEMISAKTLLHQPIALQKRFVHKDKEEGPVCFQLAANNAAELAEATKIVTDYGADLIDLNCGCPVNKIRRKGAGSKLLAHSDTLYQLITAMKQNTHLPVSIKIRVDGKSSEKYNQEIAKIVSEAGADFLIVHGRHWTEHYETPCDHEQIQFFVDQLTIPVIGNGDINSVDSLKKMLSTGCAGVMIARAGVGQPWLIQKLIAEMDKKVFLAPTLEEIREIFLDHVVRLIDLLGNEKFALLQTRQFAKYYARGLKNRPGFIHAVNDCESLADLQQILLDYW